MGYVPKDGWGRSGERVTVSVRLAPADLALLDLLVEKGKVSDIEPELGTRYFVSANRGNALRWALREAAKAKRISVPKKGK